MVEEIKRISSEQIVRWVFLLIFVWFGLLVFYEMDYAINVVFEMPHQRHPFISALVSVLLLSLVGLLLILSYVVTQVFGLLVRYAPRIGGIDVVAVAAHQFLLSYLL
ncbi:MAG: hypothetical protein C4293_20620, partial [Nitrospiraceae bacterium]